MAALGETINPRAPTSKAPAHDRAYSERMLRARIEMLADALPTMVWINPSWAILSALPFTGIFPVLGTVAPWRLAAMVAMHLLNSIIAGAFYRDYRRDPSNIVVWRDRMIVLQVLVGISWGAIVWFVWIPGNSVNHLLAVLPVVGILWVYALTRAMHLAVYLAGVIPTTVLAMARTATGGGEIAPFLTIVLPVMFAYTLAVSLTARKRVADMLHARFAKEDMTLDLREAHDLALQRRFEAEAANASKTAFLANMSHELRTPLNAIIGFSEMIASQTLGPVGAARYLDYAKDIHVAGTHLLSLIGDILDVAKIETGKMEVEPVWQDARQALETALSLLVERARDKQQTVTLSISSDAPAIYADQRALKQIVLNLISNAIKFTPIGGRISVRGIRAHDGGFELCVEDNGPGIPAEFVERLFKPFARLDNRYDRNEGGTGLGLSLVRGLAELHGGRAWIESDAGRGVKAYVYFPVGIAAAEAPRTSAKASA